LRPLSRNSHPARTSQCFRANSAHRSERRANSETRDSGAIHVGDAAKIADVDANEAKAQPIEVSANRAIAAASALATAEIDAPSKQRVAPIVWTPTLANVDDRQR